MHRIELTTLRKYRNPSEWRTIQAAACVDHIASGDGPVIQTLCKQMITDGHSGDDLAQVYRNGTLCFDAAKLSDWARGNPSGREQPAKLNSGSRKSQD